MSPTLGERTAPILPPDLTLETGILGLAAGRALVRDSCLRTVGGGGVGGAGAGTGGFAVRVGVLGFLLRGGGLLRGGRLGAFFIMAGRGGDRGRTTLVP